MSMTRLIRRMKRVGSEIRAIIMIATIMKAKRKEPIKRMPRTRKQIVANKTKTNKNSNHLTQRRIALPIAVGVETLNM